MKRVHDYGARENDNSHTIAEFNCTCELERVVKASLQLQVEALPLVLQHDGADPSEEVGVVVGDPGLGSVATLVIGDLHKSQNR